MKNLFQTFALISGKKRLSASNQLKLFLTHFILRLKSKLYPHKKNIYQNIVGFNVVCDNYELLSFLFYELFIIEEYYFEASKDAPVIYDCGSNIGMSILYFKWLYPNAVIYCFEPQPNAFKLLKENVRNNHLQDVFSHNIALSDKEGDINFYRPEGEVSLMASMIEERTSSAPITVRCEPLSKFLKEPRIDLLKIDVEGAEKNILSDLDLSKKIHAFERIIIEYHHKIGSQKSALSGFLKTLENNQIEYQILANYDRIDSFQDIIIDCYRPN